MMIAAIGGSAGTGFQRHKADETVGFDINLDFDFQVVRLSLSCRF